MQTVEYAFLLVFWNDLPERFIGTSIYSSMDLNTAIVSLDGLYEFVQSKSESFDYYEKQA